jgi:hypothetical protein
VRARVERYVGPQAIGQRGQAIDPEIATQDALQHHPTEPRAREACEVLERNAAETR